MLQNIGEFIFMIFKTFTYRILFKKCPQLKEQYKATNNYQCNNYQCLDRMVNSQNIYEFLLYNYQEVQQNNQGYDQQQIQRLFEEHKKQLEYQQERQNENKSVFLSLWEKIPFFSKKQQTVTQKKLQISQVKKLTKTQENQLDHNFCQYLCFKQQRIKPFQKYNIVLKKFHQVLRQKQEILKDQTYQQPSQEQEQQIQIKKLVSASKKKVSMCDAVAYNTIYQQDKDSDFQLYLCYSQKYLSNKKDIKNILLQQHKNFEQWLKNKKCMLPNQYLLLGSEMVQEKLQTQHKLFSSQYKSQTLHNKKTLKRHNLTRSISTTSTPILTKNRKEKYDFRQEISQIFQPKTTKN